MQEGANEKRKKLQQSCVLCLVYWLQNHFPRKTYLSGLSESNEETPELQGGKIE
jgi:hypothetical protein